MLLWWAPSGIFLSTPSARRATAKTETKSLFSNKLYNILHEFRRALIYNGSKYSLQGTTQGRYLTGGVPPVRFSM